VLLVALGCAMLPCVDEAITHTCVWFGEKLGTMMIPKKKKRKIQAQRAQAHGHLYLHNLSHAPKQPPNTTTYIFRTPRLVCVHSTARAGAAGNTTSGGGRCCAPPSAAGTSSSTTS